MCQDWLDCGECFHYRCPRAHGEVGADVLRLAGYSGMWGSWHEEMALCALHLKHPGCAGSVLTSPCACLRFCPAQAELRERERDWAAEQEARKREAARRQAQAAAAAAAKLEEEQALQAQIVSETVATAARSCLLVAQRGFAAAPLAMKASCRPADLPELVGQACKCKGLGTHCTFCFMSLYRPPWRRTAGRRWGCPPPCLPPGVHSHPPAHSRPPTLSQPCA